MLPENNAQPTKREDEMFPPEQIHDISEMLKCVEQLEEKEQLYANYLSNDDHEDLPAHHMLEHINHTISEIFNCPLQDLEHKSLAIVAIHAFYCSDELYTKWTDCEFPMFAGLLVCYILRTMRREFEGLNEFGLVEGYRKSYGAFEDHVLEILEESYRLNESKTMSTLKVKYNDLIKRKDGYTSACSVDYLIDLAMMAKCEKILNHASCRRITNERWTPKINISRTRFIAAFCTIVPVFFIKFNCTAEEKRKRSKSCWDWIFGKACSHVCWNLQKLKIFYTSPCSKFCLHTIAYFLYIILYGVVLLRPRRVDFRFVKVTERIPEILLFLWQVSFILELINSCRLVGFRKFFSSNPADVTHNFFNVIWTTFMAISTILLEFVHQFPRSYTLAWIWGILVILSKLFYVISFIFSSIRIMRVFAADSFFGSIVVMMKKMLSTLWSFLVVIILFWGTYSIAVVSLLEVASSDQSLVLSTNQTLFWSIFSNGAFEIFGELKDETREGKVKDCPEMFDSSDIRDFTIDCAFRTWMVPILLFIYVLVSSVLLVNLVTSFFTNTYEKVRDSSMLHYRYKHYQRLFEYERKILVPAPISIVYHLPLTICALVRFCGESCVCECCGKLYNYCNQGEENFARSAPDSKPLAAMKAEPLKKYDEAVIVVEKQRRKEKLPPEEYPLPVLVKFIQETTMKTREKNKNVESYEEIEQLIGRITAILKNREENAGHENSMIDVGEQRE